MNKKEAAEFIEKNDFDVQSAKAAFLVVDVVYSGYAKSKEVHGAKNFPIFVYISFRNLSAFYQMLPKKYFNRLSSKIYLDYLKNPNSLYDLIRGHNKKTKEVDELFEEYDKNKKDLNQKEALFYFEKISSSLVSWWRYGIIGEDKCEVINTEIVPRFQKRHNLSYEKAKEIMDALAHPDELTFFNQERLLFLGLCVYINNNKNKNFEKNISQYLEKFYWMKTDFYKTEEITRESIIKDVKKEIKNKGLTKIKNEIIKIKENNKNRIEKKKKILKELKLTKEDKKDLVFAEEIFRWFDLRKFVYMGHLAKLFLMIEKIAKISKMEYHEISMYSISEMIEFLKSGKKVPKNTIKKREESTLLVYQKNRLDLFYGQAGKKLFENILDRDLKKEISGLVASKGKGGIIRGKIRVIINPEEKEFLRDEILVTSMTRVEFVPLMRRAKAIITNEGGMACHAAIVSRELGIPAIIGTKSATRILKDGDIVEMNMQSGEIKIIS